MKRKIISVLLVLTVVLSVADIGVITTEAVDIWGRSEYEYVVNAQNEAVITSYMGCDRNVTVPSEIDGYPVAEIDDYCFNGESCKTSYTDSNLKKHPNRFFNNIIKTITIPSTVRKIGEFSFGNMKRLEEVIFSEGLTTIEAYAFKNSSKLEKINLPESLVDFTLLSFEGTSVEEIVLGKNVTKPVLKENEGTNVRRIICNADNIAFEEVSLRRNSVLGEIVCNGTFLGGNLKGSAVKKVVCNGGISYSTVLVMVANKYAFCSEAQGENIFFSTSDEDKKKIYIWGGFEYYLNENSEAVISGYYGIDKNVTVPDTIKNHKVTEIAPLAFSSLNFSSIRYTPYKDGEIRTLTSDKLLSVSLPDTVRFIGEFAFAYNTALERVDIPDGVEKILRECFAGCKSIKDIFVPESVKEIGERAFEECNALESLEIKGVLNIGEKAFYKCSKLKKLAVSDNLKNIGQSAFYLCDLAGEFDLSSVENIGKKAFGFNQNIEKVILNDNLTILEDGVFYNCRALKDINFPSELIFIGDNCFYQTGISNTDFGKNLKEIGNGAFTFCKLQGTLDLSGVMKIGSHAFSWNTQINKVILNDKLETLESGVFKACIGLEEINFPAELTAIGGLCFSGSGLHSAVLGEKVKEIGADAFGGCTKLCEITLPENIEKIGNFAFESTAIQTLTIPKNLSVIGYGAFQNCKLLQTLYFNAENCTVDRYLNIEEDLELDDLQNSAPFYGCNITEVFLGEGIASISGSSELYGTFENCASLEKIIIPDTVSEIGTASFKNCSSLETAVISESVTEVADDAFDGCSNLTIICFEDSYIYEYAQNNGIAVSTFVVSHIPNQTYTGKEITPEVSVVFSGDTLHKYIDFGVTYANNINVGEAEVMVKGKGDYKNFSNKTKFTIVTKSISSAVIAEIDDQAYTGNEITPDITVTDNTAGLLCEGKDYTVSYSDNKKEGTATVEIKGKGNFSGSLKSEFQIVKMSDAKSFFSRIASSIKSFFVKIGAFFQGIFNT